MSKFVKAFTAHPASVGETYLEHMDSALGFAGPLFLAALCCCVHAVLPFLFQKSASLRVARLHDRMVVNRWRNGSTKSWHSASPEYEI